VKVATLQYWTPIFKTLASGSALPVLLWLWEQWLIFMYLYVFVLRSRLTWCMYVQGGSNMTGTDLCVNKPHCAAAVRP